MADFDLEAYEKITPVATLEGVQYCVPNQHCLWRVNSFYTKEPDTIDWISSFEPDGVLIDIGASVGMFTLWAAMKQKVRVFAFEPESQNYALLCKNISINNVHDRVQAYCLAISDQEGKSGGVFFDTLYLSDFKAGGSCHNFGDEVDAQLNPVNSPFHQGSVCVSLDRFFQDMDLLNASVPIHVKIDVDGIEHKVVNSAEASLHSRKIRSVLIELNTLLDEHNHIIHQMASYGYSVTIREGAIRESGPFKGTGNHIFTLDP